MVQSGCLGLVEVTWDSSCCPKSFSWVNEKNLIWMRVTADLKANFRLMFLSGRETRSCLVLFCWFYVFYGFLLLLSDVQALGIVLSTSSVQNSVPGLLWDFCVWEELIHFQRNLLTDIPPLIFWSLKLVIIFHITPWKGKLKNQYTLRIFIFCDFANVRKLHVEVSNVDWR